MSSELRAQKADLIQLSRWMQDNELTVPYPERKSRSWTGPWGKCFWSRVGVLARRGVRSNEIAEASVPSLSSGYG
jgi:hypothetical protein